MNRAQKRILKISLIFTILIFLILPWTVEYIIDRYSYLTHGNWWDIIDYSYFSPNTSDFYMLIFQFLVLYTATFLLYKIYEGPNDKEKKTKIRLYGKI